MEESCNIPMGQVLPRRRSTEEPRRFPWAGGEGLVPDDFSDVFGGPPRTLLLRRLSGDLSLEASQRPESIFDAIFRPSMRGIFSADGERIFPAAAEGRLRTKLGFYDDIFGSDGGNRQSKVSDFCPKWQCADDDAAVSTFASKLRPITNPNRQHNSSPPSTFSTEASGNQYGAINHPALSSRLCANTSTLPQLSQANFYNFSPPDTISLKPSFTRNQKKPISGGFFGSSDIGSPSSVISSVFLETMGTFGFKAYAHHPSKEGEVEKIVMEVEERDVVESPFVIEIDSHGSKESNLSADAVDEAIAWAKEKFLCHASTEPISTEKAQTSHKQMELEER